MCHSSTVSPESPRKLTGRILVTGATGNVGGQLLRLLQPACGQFVAAVRDPPAFVRASPGIACREFDHARPQTVAAALEGVDAAFLMVPFAEQMVEWGRTFAASAARAGVRFVVRLSGLAASADCPSAMGRLHAAIDEAVRAAGIKLCVLRCNSFMQNYLGHYRGMILRRAELRLPEANARSCFVDTADVAAAAAAVLADPAVHQGRSYDLDGPEALDHYQAVALIGAATGRELHYRPIAPEQARANYARAGIPPWKIAVLQSLEAFIRDGGGAGHSDDLCRLIGRPGNSFEAFALRHRCAWMREGIPE